MGNREIPRGGNRAVADRGAIASRRGEQGGHNDNHSKSNIVTEVTDPNTLAMFCKDIANGVAGQYPIFGLKLSVQMKKVEDVVFPALFFWGTFNSDHPINMVVRPGFFLSVTALFRNPNKVVWKSAAEQALSLELLLKPEFLAAITAVRNEQAEQREKDALVAKEYLKGLEESLQKVKQKPPVLTSLSEVMSVRWGTFQHTSGAELLVCFGKHNPGKPAPIVVRVSFAPNGHVLEEMVTEKIFFFQNQLTNGLRPLAESEVLAPKVALSRTFCEWVANELSAIGIDTYKKKVVDADVGSMTGVNAEHAAELEDGSTADQALKAFRLVVDNEVQEPQAGKKHFPAQGLHAVRQSSGNSASA